MPPEPELKYLLETENSPADLRSPAATGTRCSLVGTFVALREHGNLFIEAQRRRED